MFPGTIDDHDLPALVAAAAFAFPSTREGFGLVAMEALAASVPVVAGDLPVLRGVFTAAAFASTPSWLRPGGRPLTTLTNQPGHRPRPR